MAGPGAGDFLTGGKSLGDFVSDFIIRPPRSKYTLKDLGPSKFRLGDDDPNFPVFLRRDLTLYNMRGMRICASWYVPSYFGENVDEHRKWQEREERRYEEFATSSCPTLSSKPPPFSIPCVIYCHANCGSRYDGQEAVFLLEHGFSVFTFDFCGSGQSAGKYISLGIYEQHDLAAVVDYLTQEEEVRGLGLWGRSMGAVTALLYGSNDPFICCMVCDSPFSSLLKLIEEIAQKRVSKFLPAFVRKYVIERIRKNVLQRAKFDIHCLEHIETFGRRSKVPALILHGEKDDFVLPHHSLAIRDAYSPTVPCWHQMVDGGHNSARDGAQTLIVSFLKVYLEEKPAGRRLANEELLKTLKPEKVPSRGTKSHTTPPLPPTTTTGTVNPLSHGYGPPSSPPTRRTSGSHGSSRTTRSTAAEATTSSLPSTGNYEEEENRRPKGGVEGGVRSVTNGHFSPPSPALPSSTPAFLPTADAALRREEAYPMAPPPATPASKTQDHCTMSITGSTGGRRRGGNSSGPMNSMNRQNSRRCRTYSPTEKVKEAGMAGGSAQFFAPSSSSTASYSALPTSSQGPHAATPAHHHQHHDSPLPNTHIHHHPISGNAEIPSPPLPFGRSTSDPAPTPIGGPLLPWDCRVASPPHDSATTAPVIFSPSSPPVVLKARPQKDATTTSSRNSTATSSTHPRTTTSSPISTSTSANNLVVNGAPAASSSSSSSTSRPHLHTDGGGGDDDDEGCHAHPHTRSSPSIPERLPALTPATPWNYPEGETRGRDGGREDDHPPSPTHTSNNYVKGHSVSSSLDGSGGQLRGSSFSSPSFMAHSRFSPSEWKMHSIPPLPRKKAVTPTPESIIGRKLQRDHIMEGKRGISAPPVAAPFFALPASSSLSSGVVHPHPHYQRSATASPILLSREKRLPEMALLPCDIHGREDQGGKGGGARKREEREKRRRKHHYDDYPVITTANTGSTGLSSAPPAPADVGTRYFPPTPPTPPFSDPRCAPVPLKQRLTVPSPTLSPSSSEHYYPYATTTHHHAASRPPQPPQNYPPHCRPATLVGAERPTSGEYASNDPRNRASTRNSPPPPPSRTAARARAAGNADGGGGVNRRSSGSRTSSSITGGDFHNISLSEGRETHLHRQSTTHQLNDVHGERHSSPGVRTTTTHSPSSELREEGRHLLREGHSSIYPPLHPFSPPHPQQQSEKEEEEEEKRRREEDLSFHSQHQSPIVVRRPEKKSGGVGPSSTAARSDDEGDHTKEGKR